MRFRFFLTALIILTLLASYPLLKRLPKGVVHAYAELKRSSLRDAIYSSQPGSDEDIDRVARWFSDRWQIDTADSRWRTFRRILPQKMKPDDGPTQFLAMAGYCSQLVRAARWALDGRLEIEQHDIIAPDGAHSALSVKNGDGRWVFLDPFFGLYFRNEAGIMSLDDVVHHVRSGGDLEEIGIPLRADASFKFYDDVAQSAHALRPNVMNVTIELPLKGKNRWSIGALDGSHKDIISVSAKQRLTSHLYYIGARYTSTFRFTYALPDDGRSYVLRLHLTRPAVVEELPEFSTPPHVQGKALTFRLSPGVRQLTVDSRRLRSGTWHDIDLIEVISVDKLAREN